MTEAMPFLQKYDITFLRPPTIMHRVFFCLVSHGRSETKWKGLDKYQNHRLIFY